MPGPEREDDYAALLKAVRSGDAEQEHIVEELVNMISEHDLAMLNEGGTALHWTTISGNRRMAECLIRKNKNVLSIRNCRNELPVSLALGFGHTELARYLYSQTPIHDLEEDQGCHGASLLNRCFYNGDLDMALDLMKRCPSLAFALDHQSPHVYPLETAIDHIRGAALQMQREVQWFKVVESICPPSFKETLNKDGLTPGQLFTKDHQKMRKEGERWMKDTATSCTVVGALIITIMFAAAFTIPGGNNQDTGMPILVHDKLFTLFIVADSLSLFSSTTSVLMFLGILTSRYAEEDFHKSLPRKMIIGLFALFFSIATMMIAFSTALLLMLCGKYQIVVPIIGLAGIPVILFVVMQSRLLVEMFNSTYRIGIFDRKMKRSF
ncbi:ankyrin repeat-containing protein NPR4-like [Juglans regia]|uniref:Ankyrin repeat-containing protein NPR4-like n=2 Tax=Juglans regia TaxID=51240 RepID=A0A6P9E6P8_JUGRE|nr:ankyrin repeat-containing protein NPR4-like [Juglans regia]